MFVQPYLFFEGRCEEAIDFYKRAIGVKNVQIMRYSDSPQPPPPGMVPPGSEQKVMHASFRVGKTEVLASDGRMQSTSAFQGFSLTINVSSDAEAERKFAALSEGGQVQMPLAPSFFSSRFGMLTDRFGVPWMVITTK